MSTPGQVIENRLQQLEAHLEQENPVLLQAVRSFRTLDGIAKRMGLLPLNESFAMQIPWWPLISVLGTFSAGKSTFINTYLGDDLQRSGNQAVDDKFTVICYSNEQTPHALPGVALDSDPRFPFYKISTEIEKVASGEGSRIDAYLQLKTTPSQALRGKIVIDSPGFDADAQRTSTLRITDHIIDLSDLVLVFFDARHPEPGAMRDTLDHLVSNTINRNDSGKFLYILNQLDTTAREDNPEEVVAAWQRALGERGLTAGRFYTIYNRAAAVPIEDEALRNRFESKCEHDLTEIHGRMQQVEIERAYRIVGALEKTARDLDERAVPAVSDAVRQWRKRVLGAEIALLAVGIAGFLYYSISAGHWQGLNYQADWWLWLKASSWRLPAFLILAVVGVLGAHHIVRRAAAKTLIGSLRRRASGLGLRVDLVGAFLRNTSPWRSVLRSTPAGWGRRARRRLAQVLDDTDTYVQDLNDRFTNPSGSGQHHLGEAPPPAPPGAPGTTDALLSPDPATRPVN